MNPILNFSRLRETFILYYHQLVGVNPTEAYLTHIVALKNVEITGGKLHFKIVL